MMTFSALVLVLTLQVSSDPPTNVETPDSVAVATPIGDAPQSDAQIEIEAGVDDDTFFDDAEVEEVVIETIIEPAESQEPSLVEQLSHLHPMVVHMPIAWLLLLVFVEWLLVWREDFLSDTARIGLWALTMVSFIPSLATGFLFSEFVYEGSADEVLAPILDHRNQILISAGFLALGWFIRRKRPTGPTTAILLTFSMVAMGIGAHSGGLLVYGEDYFPF